MIENMFIQKIGESETISLVKLRIMDQGAKVGTRSILERKWESPFTGKVEILPPRKEEISLPLRIELLGDEGLQALRVYLKVNPAGMDKPIERVVEMIESQSIQHFPKVYTLMDLGREYAAMEGIHGLSTFELLDEAIEFLEEIRYSGGVFTFSEEDGVLIFW